MKFNFSEIQTILNLPVSSRLPETNEDGFINLKSIPTKGNLNTFKTEYCAHSYALLRKLTFDAPRASSYFFSELFNILIPFLIKLISDLNTYPNEAYPHYTIDGYFYLELPHQDGILLLPCVILSIEGGVTKLYSLEAAIYYLYHELDKNDKSDLYNSFLTIIRFLYKSDDYQYQLTLLKQKFN